ncbi:MAG: o-succinylbenzoate--CoA ligase [Rubrobacteraceae bacterium]|nr:o-succinylbenzoate--CoA ligase [Rubrobacteraceae bacterium]
MKSDASQVPCPLRTAAEDSPDAPAIVSADGTLITYCELDRRVTAVAINLDELGLGAGARVGLYLPKDERYIVLLLALLRAGCVACPLSTRTPRLGVATLLQRAACRALISEKDLPEAAHAGVPKLHPKALLESISSVDDRPRSSDPLHLLLDRHATVVFTSGSTGTPKGTLHTFGNHYFSARGSNANIALEPQDRWLHSLPLYHVGGLSILFRCLLAGASVALPEPAAPLGEAIARSRATHVSLVSTQLLRLLREEGFDPSGLKAILLGGGPTPGYLLEEALARKLPIHTSYGLTEMASQVTATPPAASRETLRTSGRPLPHRELSISDDGEILVRGETLFAGYVEGEAIELPIDADGWFHTKDLGELDAGGYLRVRGRKDNLFISGGENVQPEEIEEALCFLEGVEEAVVVPIPDPEFGFRPAAFVRTTGGVVESRDLARALEPVLARFKIPVTFYGWPEGIEGMKVDRAALTECARRLHREE